MFFNPILRTWPVNHDIDAKVLLYISLYRRNTMGNENSNTTVKQNSTNIRKPISKIPSVYPNSYPSNYVPAPTNYPRYINYYPGYVDYYPGSFNQTYLQTEYYPQAQVKTVSVQSLTLCRN